MRGLRWLFSIIGAVYGTCFAALAARGISVLAITPHFFRISSIIFAVVGAWLSYVSFRAATSGRTDAASFQRALLGGVDGALAGFIIVVIGYVMFGQAIRAYFAHPIGVHFSEVTMPRLLVSLVCLGFGAGFALRLQRLRRR